MTEVRLRCDNGHLNTIKASDIKKLRRRAEKMLIVCPDCRPKNERLTVLDDFAGKLFFCRNNHVTEVYVFTNGMCNITCGNFFENIKALPNEMLKMISAGKVKCHFCATKLEAIDDSILVAAEGINFKTKTRVGDIWDKAGCPDPVETRTVMEDGEAVVEKTEFAKRNEARVARMRSKHGKRLSRPAGEIIHKPTNRSYIDGTEKRPTKRDLNGG